MGGIVDRSVEMTETALTAASPEFVAEQEPHDEELEAIGALEPWRPTLAEHLRETWDSRELFWPLAIRAMPNFTVTRLGSFWYILQPLFAIFGYSLLLGGVFGARAPNGTPYFLFVAIGMLGWELFMQTLRFETRGIRRYQQLTKTLKLPLLLVTIGATGRAIYQLITYGSFIVLILVFYAVTKGVFYFHFSLWTFAGIGGLALSLMYGWGVGLFLAVLTPKVQDLRIAIRMIIRIWMYCTPVLYSLQSVPKNFRTLALVNPLTPVMEVVKHGLLGSGEVRGWWLLYSVAAIAMTCFAGLIFFNRFATEFIGIGDTRFDDEDDDLI